MNVRVLKSELALKGMNMDDFAKYLKINVVTLYRKVNGISDFKTAEIIKSVELFGKQATDEIFFAR